MVLTHAAVADSAKGHVMLGHMHGAVINADAAGHGLTDNPLLQARVMGEKVERERSFMRVDISQRLIQAPVGLDGQNGAENFTLHQRHFVADPPNQGRGKFAGVCVGFGAGKQIDDFGAPGPGVLDQGCQALETSIINDRRVIDAVQIWIMAGTMRLADALNSSTHPAGRNR